MLANHVQSAIRVRRRILPDVLRHVSPPLASAYLKLMRAQEHLDPLVAEIRRFEMSRQYHIVRQTDEDAGEHLAFAVIDSQPGDQFYGPLGDVVHNLHGVLDHAVFGLSEYFSGGRLTDREARSVAFPVHTDPAKWDVFVRDGMRAIRFLPEPYRQIVESEQPCRGTNDFIRTNHPLHVLHSLWNTDKHRRIPLIAAFAQVMTDVIRVPISRVRSKDDLHPVISVEISLQECGPTRSSTGTRRPIGGFAEYMHNTVFEVLAGFQDLLGRGVT